VLLAVEFGQVGPLERLDGGAVGQVVKVAGGHADRAVPEKLGDREAAALFTG
jgi:hypothetical protein